MLIMQFILNVTVGALVEMIVFIAKKTNSGINSTNGILFVFFKYAL